MTRYYAFSRSSYYAVVASLPLLLAYQMLLALSGGAAGVGQVRNAPEVWLRSLLESLGLSPANASLFMILALILSIPLVRKAPLRLEAHYFVMMLGEVLIYALGLGIVINYVLGFVFTALQPALAVLPLLAIKQLGFTEGLALSLGAGLFEEFFFRVVLLNGLFVVLAAVLGQSWGKGLAILLAAVLFSLAHYVGSLGDAFTIYGFMFRFLAGLLFTLLYYLRGFAITAYAHALYDVFVIIGLFRIVGI